jgi:hypothetical protein
MKKRVVAAGLWFYAGWYAGMYLSDLLHVTAMIAPFVGVLVTALIAGDPMHLIWRTAAPAPTSTHEAEITDQVAKAA